jgi:predicted metal-dependent phosphoesterase TrpH
MRTKTEPLLCELHAHTTWSDGSLALDELVDLYGRAGFDVLAITDHVHRDESVGGITHGNHADYRAAIAAEGARARSRYDLLLLAGEELSWNDDDPARSAHAVAIGLHDHVGLQDDLETALETARSHGAALIAAHPFRTRRSGGPAGRATLRFAREWRRFAPLVDRWELFNRYDLLGWVAERGLPAVASGDFHRPEHLFGWKTLLPCRKDEQAVVDYLRSTRPAFLTRIDAEPSQRAA